MKIRLMGTTAELNAAVHVLRLAFDVREVSAPYRNRGDSVLSRIYVECAIPDLAAPPKE